MNFAFMLLLLLTSARYALSAVAACSTTGTQVGENNPGSKNNQDGRSNVYYLDTSYRFSCCGIVESWTYNVDRAGTVNLMVWRPLGGGTYQVVAADTDSPTAQGLYNIAASNFFVQNNDVIGWSSTDAGGTNIITYGGGGGGGNTALRKTGPLTGPLTGTTVLWTSASSENRNYALNAQAYASTAPVFQSGQTTTYSIPDTTALGTSVATVTFTDADVNDQFQLTMTSSQYFTFTDNGDGTGLISTHSTNSVSPLSGTSVTLIVTDTDRCAKTATATYTVFVTNMPPVISSLSNSVQISEDMKVETQITTFTCTDTDQLTTSLVITPSNSPKPEFFFTQLISGNTYGIYARAQSDPTLGTFDYNTQRSYNLAVKCTDGKITVTAYTVVNLKQNSPPVITNLPPPTEIHVPQNTTKGTVLFTVLFTDAESDSVTFSQTCTQAACPFTVLDSGVVQNTVDLSSVNGTGYDITYTVSDSKNSGIPRTLSIVITDINVPVAFTNMPNYVGVDENTAISTLLFTVSYSDPDVLDSHTFWALSSPSRGSTLFLLDSLTGVVTVKATLNYEAETTRVFIFNVTLSDGKANTTKTLTIELLDVNEPLTWNSPAYRTSVSDGAAVGTTVANPGFAVTDPDINDTYKCYMDCGALNGYFSMSTACVITVTSVYSLDVGLPTQVPCNVTAIDKGLWTALTLLTINCVDADNYKPRFIVSNYGFTVSAYADVGVSVGTVTATDLDTGTYGNYAYSLNQTGLPGNYFKIDGTNGLISTQVSMPQVCNCSSKTYVITALATDTGGLVGTSTVYITVGPTTTTITTTTTDRYKSFFEETRNVIWFPLVMVLLFITVVAAVFVIIKYVCTGPGICNGLGGMNRQRFYPRRFINPSEEYQFKSQNFTRAPTPPLESIRKPPPPKDFQSWRSQHM